MMRILSLGAGVQSSAVLLMSCCGELPKLDAAIFADTGWEPPTVYPHLERLKEHASAAGIPVYVVSAGNIREDMLRRAQTKRGKGRMPFYVKGEKDGSIGKLTRQCTHDYKINPIEKQIRALLGLKKGQRWPTETVVEQWFGISVDEQRRMRMSQARWKKHRYPLVFDLPRAFTRHDCRTWLQDHGFPDAPRSACPGCPFHSDAEWRRLKADPEAWAEVVAFDAGIRHKPNVRGEMFLHRRGVPLTQIDLTTPAERGQGALFDEECSGYCGT